VNGFASVTRIAAEEGTFLGLDPSVFNTIMVFLGLMLTTIIVQRVTSRNARRATELQKENEERKNSLEQAKQWRDDTVELRKQRDEDRREYEVDREEWRSEMRAMREEVASLRQQVENMTTERRDAEDLIESLTRWCKVVVVLLRQHGIPYPTLPQGITDTNPRGIPSQSSDSAL
jgi:flagellar biosynthesis GTPase FlhF